MTHREAVERFLASKRIALVGVSRNPKDFSRAVFTALVKAGYEVVPVNPGVEELEGRRCFARLSGVAPPVEAALLMVASAQAEEVTRDAIDAGVKQVWFHRGVGPGAASPAALELCAKAGVAVVDELCPFMVLQPPTGWAHRLHGWFRLRSLARNDARALPPGPGLGSLSPDSGRGRG